ncbi:MAG TPA: hypothetical protein VGR81_12165 [Candidatus Acidoferrales bacterium]|nr:hypothetical protein [Candidatus Acidoferrales bacterium]
MRLSEIGMGRLLRISSALIILGMMIEIASLIWYHPLSFVLFAFVGVSLIGLGMLIYLISLAFLAIRSTENRNSAQ